MLNVIIDQSEGISGADIPEQAVKKMRTGSTALSLPSPARFSHFFLLNDFSPLSRSLEQATKWMDHGQIEWLIPNWMAPAANGILDYVQGAWDWVRSTDPSFRGRNGLIIMADELFVQLRNVLFDVSSQLQSDLSGELLESTVSLGCNKSAVTYLWAELTEISYSRKRLCTVLFDTLRALAISWTPRS